MPAPGSTYVRKTDDHMHKLLVRPCPTCKAKIGEPCIQASGNIVKKVTEVHSARFVRRKNLADHYAPI